MAINQLSPSFTLAQLTHTDTGISNTPPASLMTNGTNLAKTLEILKTKVGPFDVLSGYRSQAVQDKLKEEGAPAADVSLHTKFLAADIKPTTMEPAPFFRKIANDPEIRKLLGEIAVKRESLHISLPTSTKKELFMYLVDMDYIPMTLKEAQIFIWRWRIPVGSILGLAAIGYLMYLYLGKGRKLRSV